MTNILEGENYISGSTIMSLLNVIYTKLLAVETDDTPHTRDLKTEIKDDLKRRYSGSKVVELLGCGIFPGSSFQNPVHCRS